MGRLDGCAALVWHGARPAATTRRTCGSGPAPTAGWRHRAAAHRGSPTRQCCGRADGLVTAPHRGPYARAAGQGAAEPVYDVHLCATRSDARPRRRERIERAAAPPDGSPLAAMSCRTDQGCDRQPVPPCRCSRRRPVTAGRRWRWRPGRSAGTNSRRNAPPPHPPQRAPVTVARSPRESSPAQWSCSRHGPGVLAARLVLAAPGPELVSPHHSGVRRPSATSVLR